MKIGDNEYKEIVITDDKGELLVNITDDDLIALRDIKVDFIPDC